MIINAINEFDKKKLAASENIMKNIEKEKTEIKSSLDDIME